jgi:hypothetical protein
MQQLTLRTTEAAEAHVAEGQLRLCGTHMYIALFPLCVCRVIVLYLSVYWCILASVKKLGQRW